MSTLLKLTFAEYERMIADGAFDSLRDKRIELIYGELREMTPPGPTHSEMVTRLTDWSYEISPKGVRIRVQNPIGVPELDSVPEPDLVWAKKRDYGTSHPRGSDIYLIIEVSASSLGYDTGLKADLFARARVKDYWVVNLPDMCLEVFRQPRAGTYTKRERFSLGSSITPLAFPEIKLSVRKLFSPVS